VLKTLSVFVLLLAALPLAALPPLPAEEAKAPGALDRELALIGLERSPDTEGGSRHLQVCSGGFAGAYECDNVDLLEQIPLATFGASSGNDIWGWTDPESGKEYALMGINNGTGFVDISDPEEPIYLGKLPTQTSNSIWRDIKVFANHAYIVSEASGHGLQVFDLTQLRSVVNPPVTFTVASHYNQFGHAHNVVINEETGHLFAVGSDACSAGLHIVDINTPASPSFLGCFSADGYTHDAQCVLYKGPDTEHANDEICFNSNEDTLTIVDVTNPASPTQLARQGYAGAAYTHQGWLTEDQHYFLLDDEGDESGGGHNTRTYIWDVSDLENPTLMGNYTATTSSTDHNQYVKGNYVYQANYSAGLRILRIDQIASAQLTEVAYFDSTPSSGSGAWSVYPYFASGTVIVSDIDRGLFVLRPTLCSVPAAPAALEATAAGDHQIHLAWSASAPQGGSYRIYRAFGSCGSPSSFELVAEGISGTLFDDTVSGQIPYAYLVKAADSTALCESLASPCASATTSGTCNAPAQFAGIEQLDNLATETCALELGWSTATPNCGSGATYNVYRSSDAQFVPSPANRIGTDLAGTSLTDSGLDGNLDWSYVVRSVDSSNSVEDSNQVVLTARPTGPVSDGTFASGAEVGEPILQAQTASGTGTRHVGWELETNFFHTGSRSYYSTDAQGSCLALVSPPITLTAGQSSALSFFTAFDLESRFDGGVLQVSTNDGATWQQLAVSPPYPSSFNNGSDTCGFTTNTPAFTGSNLSWTQYSANLAAFADQTIRLRFLYSSDGASAGQGWYIDDLTLTHTQVLAVCSGTLFADGFESGNLSGWSFTLP